MTAAEARAITDQARAEREVRYQQRVANARTICKSRIHAAAEAGEGWTSIGEALERLRPEDQHKLVMELKDEGFEVNPMDFYSVTW